MGNVSVLPCELNDTLLDALVRKSPSQGEAAPPPGVKLGAIDRLVSDLRTSLSTVLAAEGTAESSAQTGGAKGAGRVVDLKPAKPEAAAKPVDLETIVRRLKVSLPVMRAARVD